MKSGYTVLSIKVGIFLLLIHFSVNLFAFAPKMAPFIFIEEMEQAEVKALPNNWGTADTSDLLYPLEDDPYNPDAPANPFDLQNNSMQENIEYDPATGQYIITNQIGDSQYGAPAFFSTDEFMQMQQNQSMGEYWNSLQNQYGGNSNGGGNDFGNRAGSWLEGQGLSPKLLKLDEDCGFLGCGGIDIRPTGGIDLEFGFQSNRTDNPFFSEQVRRLQSQPQFLFDMNINMSVVGKIGDHINLSTAYNTKATFNFDQQLSLEYVGEEDDIIQKIEAGNVTFPLPTSLIPGVQNLFGIKTQLQFGRLTLTSVISQQQSKSQNIQIEKGAQIEEFEIRADEYQENRHFFLAQYFRNTFNQNMSTLPVITTKTRITRMQVWVTNRENDTEQARDVVAFSDLGETDPYSPIVTTQTTGNNPDNYANSLYADITSSESYRRNDEVVQNLLATGYEDIQDFRLTQARLLQPNEYTYDPQLGYISINTPLQDQDIVGVAFEYDDMSTGQSYQVGEFAETVVVDSTGTDRVLFLKMLKSTDIRPKLPIWDLMMKNVYSLRAFQLSEDDFRLDIYYETPGGAHSRFLGDAESVKNKTILQLVGLDKLNAYQVPLETGDGIFDYIEGYTIVARNGRLIFPVVEPFGEDLRAQFSDSEQEIASVYAFDSLYSTTKQAVLQFPEKNRFVIKGRYKSNSSNEYQLGAFNVPEGSVRVTAGGRELIEGVDYDINYGLGRVTIINDAYMESAVPVNISFEDPALFSFLRKSMIGVRADYWINDDFTLGSTYMRLSQRPFTQKTNYGDDAINNRIVGFDVNYFKDAPLLTNIVDKIPGLDTKEPSSITFTGEAARLIPGHAKAIDGDSNGVVFVDDFEGTKSVNFLDQPLQAWSLSSTPRSPKFPEYSLINDLDYGKNRARLAWYRIDQILSNSGEDASHYNRQVNIREIFPETDVNFSLTGSRLFTFDMAYYPDERGPYNFDTDGLTSEGKLRNPEDRWGGISRELVNTNFERQNYEYIEFWMMDPFIDGDPFNQGKETNEGEFIINLGTVSEDVLKDGKRFFENGLPRPGGPQNVDTTAWGRIPLTSIIANTFDSNEENRTAQDVGFDGMNNDGERALYADYLAALDLISLDPEVKAAIINDPANDDYRYYNDGDFDSATPINVRYKQFNNPDGNADVAGNQLAASSNPDMEDLNSDNLLEQSEAYYEYAIQMERGMDASHPYIVNVVEGDTLNGVPSRWLQFQIPINEPTNNVGGIEGFRAIQFMRMYMTGFEQPVICRMARMGLVRNVWRKYEADIKEPGEYINSDNDSETVFNVTAVSLEESSGRQPIPYEMPPGTIREFSPGTTNGVQIQQNEQALAVQVCGLQDGSARAVFKTEELDMRQFKRLQMWIHAEQGLDATHVHEDGDVSAIIRIGDDFSQNYYEYEVPLALTEYGEVIREDIWPEANRIDIELDELVEVKKTRNYSDLDFTDYTRPYTKFLKDENGEFTGRKVTVVGNPDLGDVKNLMLGVRNPKRRAETLETDDGYSKCVEVWFNELALADFNEQGGWAAQARMDMKLADFGDVTVSGNMHTAGFGTIEQRVTERYLDNLYEVDAIGNFRLDKFLPKGANMQIPLQMGYTRSVSNPEYDPFNTDILLEEKLDSIELNTSKEFGIEAGKEARKDAKKEAQDFISTKSINLTGVKKLRDPKKKKAAKPWDVENITLGYSYTEVDERNPVIEAEIEKQHRATLDYTYTAKPKYITPFKKWQTKSKYASIIKDFNFNLVPRSIGFRTGVNRRYESIKLRTFQGDDFEFPTSYNKQLTWSRDYNLDYDLAKSLGVKFLASNESIIDENQGANGPDERRQLVRDFWTEGRNFRYNQSFTVNYNLPLKKIPILEWLDASAKYQADYDWMATSRFAADSLGNTVSNQRGIQLNANLNFNKFYDKFPTLKKLDRPSSNRPSRGGGKNAGDDNAKGNGEISGFTKAILRPITMLKRASINYSLTHGTDLPGFMLTPELLGQNWQNGQQAPGLDFTFGMQPNREWLERAAQNGWISENFCSVLPFMQRVSRNFSTKATLEPIKDLKIDINLTSTYSDNYQENFKVDENGVFQHLFPRTTGSYTVSYMPIRTMYSRLDTNNISEIYHIFEDNRTIISQRLQALNPNSVGNFFNPIDTSFNERYADGFGPLSQDVLIPAFLAAYNGIAPEDVKLNGILKQIPKPNWRITYNGLSKLKAFKKVFQSFNITHGYASTYSVNSFQTEDDFEGDVSPELEDFYRSALIDTISGNFYSYYTIPGITISEQFAPLIGIDMGFNNGVVMSFKYNKSRTLNLNFLAYELIEQRSEEIVVGFGFKLQGLSLPFKVNGEPARLNNDINFRTDFSYRDNLTMNKGIDKEFGEDTNGSKIIQLTPTVDYVVNDRIKVSLFYERTRTIPYTTRSFPSIRQRGGVRISLSLAQ